MTTIAYRDGVMVATTGVWTAIYRGQRNKIMRVGGSGTGAGALMATCGDSDMAFSFHKWLEDGENQNALPRIPEKSDFAAIVVYPNGSVVCFTERFLPQPIIAEFHAMGSGDQLALGAMAMGASAEEAVRVACKFDPWSREPLQIEHLSP
jgi:hypothetical protein